MKLLTFSDGSLSQQWPFRLALGIPILASLLLCLPLWISPSITFNLTSDGYNKFLEIFKFPIVVLSLSIPLVAIVAHIHRTIQTASQIDTTKKKNLADSFFSHHKYITEALGKLPSIKTQVAGLDFEYKITDPYSSYNFIFEDSNYKVGVITDNLYDKIKIIEENIKSINEIIYKFKQESFPDMKDEMFALHNLNNSLNFICFKLSISTPEKTNNRLVIYKNEHGISKLVMPFMDESEIKKKIFSVNSLCQKTFSLINVDVSFNTTTRVYSHSNEKGSFYMNSLFNCSIKTNQNPCYAISNNNSQALDEQYNKYLRDFNA